jgi:predicted RNase H-like HicB family nuclease
MCKKLAYNCANNWRNIMSTKPFQLTAVIEREDDWFVATCPEVDVVSQGKTIEDARANLLEAVELFLEVASPSEIKRRLKTETYVMPLMPVVRTMKAKPSARA